MTNPLCDFKVPRQQMMDFAKILMKFNDEALMHIGPEGIFSEGISSSIAMLQTVMQVKSPGLPKETISILVDATMLNDAVTNAMDASEDVRISVDPDSQVLHIKDSKMSHRIHLLDPTTIKKIPRLPDLSFTSEVEIGYPDAIKANKALSKTGCDHVIFQTTDDDSGFKFEAKSGDEFFKVVFTLLPMDMICHRPGISESRFPLEFIDDFMKSLPKDTTESILIELGKDYPVMITAKMPQLVARLMVAPQIDED